MSRSVKSAVGADNSTVMGPVMSCCIRSVAVIALVVTAGCSDIEWSGGPRADDKQAESRNESSAELHPRVVRPQEADVNPFEPWPAETTSVPVATSSVPVASPRTAPQMAPEIELNLLDGGHFSLKQHRAQNIVILDFWASWCSPCVEELPVVTEVAAEFREKNVVLCAVNVGEDAAKIRQFLAGRDLQLMVGSDVNERVANAYGAKTLPTLVLIDRQGNIQRVHEGHRPDLKSVLRNELATLVAGGSLSETSPPLLAGAASRGESRRHKQETYQMSLSSGRVLDVGRLMRSETSDFRARLGKLSDAGRLLRLTYPGGNTSMLIGRHAAALHGPTAAYYLDGAPMAHVTYENGKREKTLFSWDEAKRPLIFEQYESGRRHGLCCLFHACCEECKEGHLWLVQEWQRGKLLRSHLVGKDGEPITFANTSDESAPGNEELEQARVQMQEFHAKLDESEKQLKQSIVQLRRQEKQIIAARKQAARNQLMAALAQRQRQMVGQFRPSGRLTVCRTGRG